MQPQDTFDKAVFIIEFLKPCIPGNVQKITCSLMVGLRRTKCHNASEV